MPKPPTPKDLEILALLERSNCLSSIEIQKKAGTIDHRDCIFRLRKAGHNISSYRVNYTNKQGKRRWYMNYSILKQTA